MSDSQANLKPLLNIVSRQFSDVDELAELMRVKQEANIVQLSLKPFQARVVQADFNDFSIFQAEVNCAVHQTGARRAGYVQFDILLNPEEATPTLVHNRPVDTDTLWSFDFTRGSDTILPAHTSVVDVHIKQELFATHCQLRQRDDLLEERFLKSDLLRLPLTLSNYRNYVMKLLHLIEIRSPLLQTANYQQLVVEKLLDILLDSIPRAQAASPQNLSPLCQTRIARQAREYMLAHLERSLTLKELYQELDTSRRNLFYSFEATFGVTPMRYFKLLRLQGLRRALKAAEPETTTVMNLASRWGFWSTGHLARDYKMIFGELPSKTLHAKIRGKNDENFGTQRWFQYSEKLPL
jgi:AraC family ethanolamine operon transcriptional activator